MTEPGFRELRVWQGGVELAEAIYRLTASFPRHETYGLSSQIQRAAVSVPANVAEGQCRDHLPEYIRFVSIARGSLAEVDTHLELAVRLAYVSRSDAASLFDQIAVLARQLTTLRQRLKERLEQQEQARRAPAPPNPQSPIPNPS